MKWPRRRRDGRSRFESGLMSVMGPASIGDPSAPLTYQPPPADLLCPRCGLPWEEHRVVRTDTTTIAHCPPPNQDPPPPRPGSSGPSSPASSGPAGLSHDSATDTTPEPRPVLVDRGLSDDDAYVVDR